MYGIAGLYTCPEVWIPSGIWGITTLYCASSTTSVGVVIDVSIAIVIYIEVKIEIPIAIVVDI